MIKIKMLRGECWWGGKAPDGCSMPYDENSIETVDIRKRIGENDQSASMFISSCGRYIWNDNPFTAEFREGQIILSDENSSPFDIGEGFKTLRGAYMAVMEKHFPFTGTLPHKLFFTAPQYNTWMELGTEQTTENILRYAEGIIDNGLPAGIIMIDGGWQEDYGVFEFHRSKIPDPATLVYKLHKMGFKVILWTSPIVSGAGVRFKELLSKGYFVKTKDDEVAIRHWWSGYSPMIDFTNPAAVEWMHSQLDSLVSDTADLFVVRCHPDYPFSDETYYNIARFAKERGMVGIKGHRSVGGFRASIYNACPKESVQALVDCMKEFEALKK